MKCTVARSVLLKSLRHVQDVVGKRAATPILANIYLETKASRLYLRITDMELELVETVFCETERMGCATIPAYMVYEIVKKLPNGIFLTLEHDSDKEELVLRFERSCFILKSLPVSNFPSLMDDSLPVTFNIKGADLHSLIVRTSFAMSTEATRYYLNGLSFHAIIYNNFDVLRAIATDGYRLARMDIPLQGKIENIPNVIIPRKTIGIIRSLTENLATDVAVSLSHTKVRFSFNSGIILISKLLDGVFPDCERVIPQHNDNDKIIEVNAKSLAEAVVRVATVMATDKTRAVKLDVRKDSLVLSALNTTTTDSAVEEIDAACAFAPFSIGFNSRYLLDILGQMVSETVCFSVSDASSPTVVWGLADSSALYVLMPIRV